MICFFSSFKPSMVCSPEAWIVFLLLYSWIVTLARLFWNKSNSPHATKLSAPPHVSYTALPPPPPAPFVLGLSGGTSRAALRSSSVTDRLVSTLGSIGTGLLRDSARYILSLLNSDLVWASRCDLNSARYILSSRGECCSRHVVL
jgi:hypothetical protein